MVDLWRVVTWVRWGVDLGAFPWLSDGWHEKKQRKDPKYHLLSHNRAMTNRYMGNIYGNHADHAKIKQECMGYTGGRLG